jgi:hypothetical protein
MSYILLRKGLIDRLMSVDLLDAREKIQPARKINKVFTFKVILFILA